MSKYVDTKIWISTFGGVIGFDLEEINQRIDEYNSDSWLRNNVDFWDWLSDHYETYLMGFSYLWKSKLMSKVHRIRGIDRNER